MGGAGGWLWRPGGPGGLVLLFTVAGLAVIVAALTVGVHHLPELHPGPSDPVKIPADAPETIAATLKTAKRAADTLETIAATLKTAKRAADTLETIAATLKTISEAPPDDRNGSVTVRLDKDQWQNIGDAVAGLREFNADFARHAGGIAADVEKAAGIAFGVQKLSETTDGIAKNVRNISKEAKRIEASIGSMTGPWGCVSPSCLGTVRFPHNEPTPSGESSEARVDAECDELWAGDIPAPTTNDLGDIAEELKRRKPSSIWILGHASTLGSKRRNDDLSWRRARFVECRLKDTLKDTLEESLRPSIKTCAAGEKASKDSLRYPDFRYRLVQVLSDQPPEELSGLECE